MIPTVFLQQRMVRTLQFGQAMLGHNLITASVGLTPSLTLLRQRKGLLKLEYTHNMNVITLRISDSSILVVDGTRLVCTQLGTTSVRVLVISITSKHREGI